MAPRTKDTIYDLADKAAPAVNRLRQGLPLKQDAVAPVRCKLVRGKCPVCERKINLKLGSSRQAAAAQPAPRGLVSVGEFFAGFSLDPNQPDYAYL